MKLIKAIHMPTWSVELFDMNLGYGIFAKNFKTGVTMNRVFRTYDNATIAFELVLANMEGN